MPAMTASVPAPDHADLFGHPAAVACERAVADLRAGRPVRMGGADGQDLAVLALDSATAHTYAQFARLAGGRHQLLLTGERARVLGLNDGRPARLALEDTGFAGLAPLAWLRPALPVRLPVHPPGALDAAAVELSRLALLLPALAAVDVAGDDPLWAAALRLPAATLEEALAREDSAYHIVARTPVPLREAGWSEFVVFRGGIAQRDQVAIIVGEPDLSAPVPVRVHSSCLTGDLFGSLKCDCGDQLRHGLLALREKGGGVLLYLDQEGRGTGIGAKMRAYGYQHEGLDTIDADAMLGFGPDGRRYGAAAAMLRALGIGRVELLSNNPTKARRLAEAGITVTGCSPVTGEVTDENEQYLRTKARRAGHLLDVDALIAAAQR